jgi:hypothetical protein
MSTYIDSNVLMTKISGMFDRCKKDPKISGLTVLFQVIDAIKECPTIYVKKDGEQS